MHKIVYSTSANISYHFCRQLDPSLWCAIAAEPAELLSVVLREKPDFLIVQVLNTPAFYRGIFMQMYLAGCSPHIMLFSFGREIQFSSSSNPSNACKSFLLAKDALYKLLFLSIMHNSSSFADGLQIVACPDISQRAKRFVREEHLREIVSGVPIEQFYALKSEFSLDLNSNAGYYMIVTKAMPFNYFDDYTNNRRVYRMLDELLRDEMYELLRRYCGGEFFELSNNSHCICINDFYQPSARKYKDQYDSLLREIRRLTDDGMTALFVSRHIDSPSDFNRIYRECITAKRMRLFYGEQELLSVSSLSKQHDPPDINELEKCLSVIRSFTLVTPPDEIKGAINRVFLQILKPSANINMYYYCCSAINVVYDSLCHKYSLVPERRSMSRCFDKYTTVEEIAEHYINIFLNIQNESKKGHSRDDLLTMKMVSYIEQNYAFDICLEKLADNIGFSASYTSRYFHRRTGKTFSQYLSFYRIEKAKELLSLSSRPVINDIAEAVGYRDAQFFSRVFKRIEGCTPSEYAARQFKEPKRS